MVQGCDTYLSHNLTLKLGLGEDGCLFCLDGSTKLAGDRGLSWTQDHIAIHMWHIKLMD